MYFSKFEASGPIFASLDDSARYSRFEQYKDSKLLLMIFIAKLAERIDPGVLTINVSNPGLTAGTGLGKSEQTKAGPAARLLIPPSPPPSPPLFIRVVGSSASVGASNYIHALLAVGSESHGGFVSDWALSP